MVEIPTNLVLCVIIVMIIIIMVFILLLLYNSTKQTKFNASIKKSVDQLEKDSAANNKKMNKVDLVGDTLTNIDKRLSFADKHSSDDEEDEIIGKTPVAPPPTKKAPIYPKSPFPSATAKK